MRPANYQAERGERQIKRLLDAVAIRPMTARDLAKVMSVTVSAVLLYTARLRAEPRRLHVAGYAPTAGSRPAPLYAAGDLPDATYVPRRKAKLPKRRIVSQMERVIAALSVPRTSAQLAEAVSLTMSRARFYIAVLRKEKRAYIKDWSSPPARGDLSPVYALGNRADKPKKRQTRAERYRLEIADPDRHELILSRKRARSRVAKAISAPQNWASPLLGTGSREVRP